MPRLAVVAILQQGRGHLPPGTKQASPRIMAPARSAGLIEQLRAADISVIYHPVTKTLQTDVMHAVPVSVGAGRWGVAVGAAGPGRYRPRPLNQHQRPRQSCGWSARPSGARRTAHPQAPICGGAPGSGHRLTVPPMAACPSGSTIGQRGISVLFFGRASSAACKFL